MAILKDTIIKGTLKILNSLTASNVTTTDLSATNANLSNITIDDACPRVVKKIGVKTPTAIVTTTANSAISLCDAKIRDDVILTYSQMGYSIEVTYTVGLVTTSDYKVKSNIPAGAGYPFSDVTISSNSGYVTTTLTINKSYAYLDRLSDSSAFVRIEYTPSLTTVTTITEE